MAKRFTDSEKWKKKWFKNLTPMCKLFWIYLFDNCNHAGVWEVDFELAAHQIRMKLDEEKITTAFRDRVTPIDGGERWFINEFIDFQYGELRKNNTVHQAVLKILTMHGLLDKVNSINSSGQGACPPLAEPTLGEKDKEEAKAWVKETVLEEDENPFIDRSPIQYCRVHDLKHKEAFCPQCVERC
jgi:hypothetical protein